MPFSIFFRKFPTVTGFESLKRFTSIFPFVVIKVIELTSLEQSIKSFWQ